MYIHYRHMYNQSPADHRVVLPVWLLIFAFLCQSLFFIASVVSCHFDNFVLCLHLITDCRNGQLAKRTNFRFLALLSVFSAFCVRALVGWLNQEVSWLFSLRARSCNTARYKASMVAACKYACKPEKMPFWQATANITQGKNKKSPAGGATPARDKGPST